MAPVLTVAATVILARLPVPAMPRFALGFRVRRATNQEYTGRPVRLGIQVIRPILPEGREVGQPGRSASAASATRRAQATARVGAINLPATSPTSI